MGKKTFAHYLWWTDTAAGVTASYAEVKSEISGKKGGSCKGFNELETAQAALKIKKCEIFGSETKTPLNEDPGDQAGVSAAASSNNVSKDTDLDRDYRDEMSETLLTALTEIPDETEGHDNENGNKEPPLNSTSNTIDSAIRSELDYIWSKINNIESRFDFNHLTKRLNDVENENAALKNENMALRSDLNNALNENMQIQEENKSLNKVIQIIIKDIPTSYCPEDRDKIICEEDEDGFIEVARKKKSGNKTKFPAAQESSESRNGRGRNKPDANGCNESPLIKPPRNKPTKQSRPDPARENQSQKSPSAKSKLIYIAGDSILKNLQGHKMSHTAKVKVSSFPGCTTRDMHDHIKPLLRRSPDEIILHVGTNSLRSTDSPACADEIIDIGRSIKNNHPDTKVTLSTLVARNDNDVLTEKVNEVNNIIRKHCRENNWALIEHDKITPKHLNHSGLHLNKSGTALFAKNFISHISSN